MNVYRSCNIIENIRSLCLCFQTICNNSVNQWLVPECIRISSHGSCLKLHRIFLLRLGPWTKLTNMRSQGGVKTKQKIEPGTFSPSSLACQYGCRNDRYMFHKTQDFSQYVHWYKTIPVGFLCLRDFCIRDPIGVIYSFLSLFSFVQR